MERQLIKEFESLIGADAATRMNRRSSDMWRELLSLPLNIRGFGPVKLANAQAMQKRRAELLAQLTIAPGRLSAPPPKLAFFGTGMVKADALSYDRGRALCEQYGNIKHGNRNF